MPKVYYDSKDKPAFDLKQSDDLIAVRTRSKRSIARSGAPVPAPASAELDDSALVAAYPDAGVEVYRVPGGKKSVNERKARLREAPDVRFAGGVLVDPVTKEPVLYTENLFIKFTDQTDPEDCIAAILGAGLTIKQSVDYAVNGYFVGAPEGTGQKVFDIALNLLKRPDVEYCHPELIRPRARKGIFPQQWHLKKTSINGLVVDAHAGVEYAHMLTLGSGVTIAIIDDGVDIDHPEFSSAGKVVSPRDATAQTSDPRPKDTYGTGPDDGDNHGTACAGVACGDGTRGACGVAPQAKLMPIRLASGLGSMHEANAFKWAADHGADVISCSWGPPDGRWFDNNDARHTQAVPLPPSTRLAIDYAVENGRNGKGCVVLFAAGNGNESVDNDGYASYVKVIAVAACNDRNARSVYSDFGGAVWCAFPSNDRGHAPFNHPSPLTTGIWTTDRVGADGYNVGQAADGDTDGLFTNSFGGTSSACPGVAGVAALVLSLNPDLKWHEVREIFRKSCDKIDQANGGYDQTGHSPKYGYGRLNAHAAVLAAKPQVQSGAVINRTFDEPIPDLKTVKFSLYVAESAPVQQVDVDVDIKHSYIGDLIISLHPPGATGVAPITLHSRTGGATKNLKKSYDKVRTPALDKFKGKNCQGPWTFVVQDAAPEDSGRVTSFGLRLTFKPAVPASPAAASTPKKKAAAPAKKKQPKKARVPA